jgi:hypothetical protein
MTALEIEAKIALLYTEWGNLNDYATLKIGTIVHYTLSMGFSDDMITSKNCYDYISGDVERIKSELTFYKSLLSSIRLV